MKPLSLRRRRMYLFIFGIIFCITIPLLILYATGYRLGDALNLVRTGGLHISVPYSGARVLIGDSVLKETSVFQKNIFVQNLRPGSYEVKVEKEGLQSWSKRLIVFPQRVTEGYAFLLPKEIKPIEIPEFLIEGTGTSTPKKPQKENYEYTNAIALFTRATTTATSSDFVKTRRKLSVENIKGTLHATWKGDMDSIPHYFCLNESCKEDIIIEASAKVRTFDFFPGRDDLLVVALPQGVYAIEIDDRSLQNIQTIYEASLLDFRIKDDEIIILEKGKKIFKVSL